MGEARIFRRLRHADHAARRAGDDSVLAAEEIRRGEAAIRGHEEQPRVAQRSRNARGIARQNRRQIRIRHRGIAARHEFHQGHGVVAGGDLRETHRVRDFRRALFMRGKAIAMHEHDGAGFDAAFARGFQIAAQRRFIEHRQHVALGGHALIRLDHAFVKHVRQLDLQREQLGPVLIADAQLVAQALRRHQHGALAFAGQQRIGGDCRTHAHFADPLCGDRGIGGNTDAAANAFQRRVVIGGIFGKKFQTGQCSVRRLRHHIGERAAAIDIEIPASAHKKNFTQVRSASVRTRAAEKVPLNSCPASCGFSLRLCVSA